MLLLAVLSLGWSQQEVYSHNEIREILYSDTCDEFRTEDGNNILHLAFTSGDTTLAYEAYATTSDSLVRQQNTLGRTPVWSLILSGDTTVMFSLDKKIDISIDWFWGSWHLPHYGYVGKEYPTYVLNSVSEVDDSLFEYLMEHHNGAIEFPWMLQTANLYHSFFEKGKYRCADAIVQMFDSRSYEIKMSWLEQEGFHRTLQDSSGYLFFLQVSLPVNTHIFDGNIKRYIYRNYFEVIRLLVDQGQIIDNPSVFNSEIKTLRDYAREEKRLDIAEFLDSVSGIPERWFELQSPDYFPSSPLLEDSNWVVLYCNDSAEYELHRGKIPLTMMSAQPRSYLSDTTNVYLFAIRSNIPVDTIVTSHGRLTLIEPYDTISFSLNDKRYTLFTKELPTRHEAERDYYDPPCYDYRFDVYLSDGENEQYLFELDKCENGWPDHILWAGDIDGDQKLDLLTDSYPGEGWFQLWLSSYSNDSQIVSRSDNCPTLGTYERYHQIRYIWGGDLREVYLR